MFSRIFREKYNPQIQKLLQKKLVAKKQQVENILEKNKLELTDIYILTQTSSNKKLRNLVIETAAKKREKLWKNRLFLVPPLYFTDRCINDCLYCSWRRSNPVQRRKLNNEELKNEIDFLIKQGYRTIELVGASDTAFTVDKTAEFISLTNKKLKKAGSGMVGLNIDSASKDDYNLFVKSGLNFMALWQETYHPETYKKIHPKYTKKADMDYRLNAFDRAIQSKLKKIGIAFLGRLYDWRYEVLALFAHARYLEETYKLPPFIIGTPRYKNAKGNAIENNLYDYPDEAWLLTASIYKLAFPKSLPWFSTRAKFELSKEAARGGGALFTLDCSTCVGGYTSRKNFPQFPVYSKPLSEGIKWLKALGFNPEFHLPY